jgi:hypothetical protein
VARFYRVTIPSGHVLTATATSVVTRPGELGQVFLQLHGSCDDTQCLAADKDGSQQFRTLKYSNNSDVAVTAILSVGGDLSVQSDLHYMLNVETHLPSLNNSCSSATNVTDGSFLQQQVTSDGGQLGGFSCLGSGFQTLFYKVTLSPLQTVTVTVSPSSSALRFVPPSIAIISGCNPVSCLSTPQFGQPVTTFRNPSNADLVVFVAVSSVDNRGFMGPSGSFDLRFQLSEPPGLVTTEAALGLMVSESGTTAQFTIKVNSPPKSPVTLDLSSSDPLEVSVSPSKITFTAENWRTPAVITAKGVDDLIADGAREVTITTSPAVSLDPRFSGKDPADVVIVNHDNEPGLYTSVTNVRTSNKGLAAQTIPVRLNSKPSQPVTLMVTSSHPLAVNVSPSTLVFTPETWNTEQFVSVVGIEGALTSGALDFKVVIDGSSSADAAWVAIPALRIPGQHTAYAFQERAAVSVSGIRRCDLGFSQWDKRITVDRGGRLYVALVCQGEAEMNPDSGFVSPKQATFVVTSEDGGKSFSELQPTGIENASNVSLAGGPAGTAYLAASTPIVGTLLRTRDGGRTWDKVSGYSSMTAGFASVFASGDNVTVANMASTGAQLHRNATLGDGAFESFPLITKFDTYSLMADSNGTTLWQVATRTVGAIRTSDDLGKTFKVRAELPDNEFQVLSNLTAGGNVIWATGPGSAVFRLDLETEKDFKAAWGSSGFNFAATLVADNTGGVTLLTTGPDGSLRAIYVDRKGNELRGSKVLDTKAGQVSAVLLQDKTIAYTYARGSEQRFGILSWP